ncbi:MAG: thioesterase family protein [bacterium]
MYQPFETYRGFVYPWCMDHVGHMNVQSYTARFDEATWQFTTRLGLSARTLGAQRRAMVAADNRTQYRREVVSGMVLHICTELVSVGRSSVRFIHRMYDSETGDELAICELVGVHFDTDARVAVPLPEHVGEYAKKLLLADGEAAALMGKQS